MEKNPEVGLKITGSQLLQRWQIHMHDSRPGSSGQMGEVNVNQIATHDEAFQEKGGLRGLQKD